MQKNGIGEIKLKSIINKLTIALAMLIAYSVLITFIFLFTSNELESTKSELFGTKIRNEMLEKKIKNNS